MQQTKDAAIDAIINNLVMANKLMPHEIKLTQSYLQTLDNLKLAEGLVESRKELDHYYETKWSKS